MASKWTEMKKAKALRIRFFLNLLRHDPCTDCGRKYPIACMEFDHCMGTKTQEVATFTTWSRVLRELKKCELVCANCHRIRTSQRRGEMA